MAAVVTRYYGNTQLGNPAGPAVFQGTVVTFRLTVAADYVKTVGFPLDAATIGMSRIDHVLPHFNSGGAGIALQACWNPSQQRILLFKQDGSTGGLVECDDADAALHEGDTVVAQVLGLGL